MTTRIGFIGSGKIGTALARSFRLQGYPVRIANSRGPQTLEDFERETGAIASTVDEVFQNSDVIVVAVQLKAIPTLSKELFAQLSPEVVVVETHNYISLKRDGVIPELENGLLTSVWIEQQIGHPVIKAFNNIFAS
jgi:predicted dinucleotide-binding enzyme